MHQQGFYLVIGSVTDCDCLKSMLLRNLKQVCVANNSCGSFDRFSAFFSEAVDVFCRKKKLDAILTCGFLHELGILSRIGAELVVHVGDGNQVS